MAESANPYSAPTARVEDREDLEAGDAARVRREYLKHEASVRSIGTLYYFGGALFLIAGFMLLFGARAQFGLGAGLCVVGLLYLAVARGVRKLMRWARNLSGALSVIGLLGFPLGTLISGYFLWLLFSAKGKVVFSPEYRAVVAATPEIKYRTPILVWILVALLIAVIASLVLFRSFV